MTSRTYATLDRNALGPGLYLSESGLIVTTIDSNLDLHRMIQGTLPAMSGQYSYEIYFWSQSRGSLANQISFGIAQPGSDLTTFVGEESTSYGFRVSEGEIWNNNASVASIDAQAERIPLGVHLSLSPTLCTCDWLVNGSVVHTETLPNGKAWLPAITICGGTAGDLSAVIAFGQNRFDALPYPDGWSQLSTGLATIYLSLCTEAFMSAAADDDPNRAYGPYILNSKQISVRREPAAWFHRDGAGGGNPAAISTLQLDNSTGVFNALLDADARDSTIVLQVIDAPPGGRGSIDNAAVMFTGIVESIAAPDSSKIEVTLRDTLSRLDKPLPCRVIAPFYDQSGAGKIWPIGLGAQRNIQPTLLDEPNLIYALGDAPMTDVPLVSDMAAPLDPNALPPQYVPALGGAAVQLATSPFGRLAADCSSVGQQYVVPSAVDVLNGDGDFTTWTSGVPNVWDLPVSPPGVVAHGSIAQTSAFGTPSAMGMTSNVPYNPGAGLYGYPVNFGTAVLEPGATYRITFNLNFTSGSTYQGTPFGLAIMSALSRFQADWITPFEQPLTATLGVSGTYTFIYTVPRGGSPRPLYISCIAAFGGTTPTTNAAQVVIDNVFLQRLGQYLQAPLQGIILSDAMTEILVNRAGEDASVFSTLDCNDLDDQAGYQIGVRFEDAPNTLDAITKITDQWGAVDFTDSIGAVRVRRLNDPETGFVVAAFSKSNIALTDLSRTPDLAKGLTSLFGARHNWTPFGPSDFVSDTITVNASIRAQYQGESQFNLQSSVNLAQEYKSAQGAPRNHLWIDDPQMALAEANRVCALFSKKRTFFKFTALYEDLTLGIGPTIAPQDLFYGDVITVDIPELGMNQQRMAVVATELFICDNRITITGWY